MVSHVLRRSFVWRIASLILLVLSTILSYQNCAQGLSTSDESNVSSEDAASTGVPVPPASGDQVGSNPLSTNGTLEITVQPASVSVISGAAVSFAVSSDDTSGLPLTYQWYFNGAAISGATSSSYSLSKATGSNQGYYFVKISNGTLTLNSSSAALVISGITCTNGTVYGGHCYVLYAANDFWSGATACSNLGGYLAKVTSLQEDAFIHSLSASTALWIGGSDQGSEGNWSWRDGTAVTTTFWAAGEPNNGKGKGENCMQITTSGYWNDEACTTKIPYVCEFE